MECAVCHKVFSERGLHGHVKKAHALEKENYYHIYFPRTDKLDGSLIKFKNYEQYFSSDFNTRENFIQWAADNKYSQELKDYCFKFLVDRKLKKGIVYVPSQTECKSLFFPSMIGFKKMFESKKEMETFVSSTGLKLRFDYFQEPIIDQEKSLKIYIDSREKLPLNFNCPTEKMKLPAGDYVCNENYFSDVFVERKSIDDLVGTLCAKNQIRHNFDRFCDELEKAKSMGHYIVVVVEGLFSDTITYSNPVIRNMSMNGAHVMHQLREIMLRFDNVQFVFTGTRGRAAELIETIFRMKKQVTFVDLEYLKDSRLI